MVYIVSVIATQKSTIPSDFNTHNNSMVYSNWDTIKTKRNVTLLTPVKKQNQNQIPNFKLLSVLMITVFFFNDYCYKQSNVRVIYNAANQ